VDEVSVTTEERVKKIRRTVARIKKEMPSLSTILNTYGKIFVERARCKGELSYMMNISVSSPDHYRFSQGMTLINEGIFPLAISNDYIEKIANRMIPVLSRSFPEIRPSLRKVRAALKKNQLDLKSCMENMLSSHEEFIYQTASSLGTDASTLKFIAGHLLKPLIEKQSEKVRQTIQTLRWQKGYCPICGSSPVLSYLKGVEGQRWLVCSVCGHEWHFMRTQCPFCDNEDPKKLELCFVQDRSYEWAELCNQCKRYLVNIDLRKYPYEFIPEVAVVGTMYLDILAQQKGFLPMANSVWTLVPHLDVPSKRKKTKIP